MWNYGYTKETLGATVTHLIRGMFHIVEIGYIVDQYCLWFTRGVVRIVVVG